jgi:hypothetical protein
MVLVLPHLHINVFNEQAGIERGHKIVRRSDGIAGRNLYQNILKLPVTGIISTEDRVPVIGLI